MIKQILDTTAARISIVWLLVFGTYNPWYSAYHLVNNLSMKFLQNYDVPALLWTIVVILFVIGLWALFIKNIISLMGQNFFLFWIALIGVFVFAIIMTFQLTVRYELVAQIIIGIALTWGIMYPSFRRYISNVGSVFATNTVTKDTHHGNNQQ